jgi:hypothetical protein
MKQFFSILFVAFALSLTASAQQTIALDVNGLEVVTTKAEIIQKLGKPSSSRKKVDDNECRGNFLLVLRYPGLTLELEDTKYTTATATVTSPKWSFSGIRIGASIDEVRKRFGDSESERKKALDYLYYTVGDGGAEFIFRKGKLVKIYWEFNFC